MDESANVRDLLEVCRFSEVQDELAMQHGGVEFFSSEATQDEITRLEVDL